jgi:hypothetical protein
LLVAVGTSDSGHGSSMELLGTTMHA